jgi:hypothetical protein
MIELTYIMQGVAVCLGLSCFMLAIAAAGRGRLGLAGINVAILLVNVVLFFWQGELRAIAERMSS